MVTPVNKHWKSTVRFCDIYLTQWLGSLDVFHGTLLHNHHFQLSDLPLNNLENKPDFWTPLCSKDLRKKIIIVAVRYEGLFALCPHAIQ